MKFQSIFSGEKKKKKKEILKNIISLGSGEFANRVEKVNWLEALKKLEET